MEHVNLGKAGEWRRTMSFFPTSIPLDVPRTAADVRGIWYLVGVDAHVVLHGDGVFISHFHLKF